MIKLGDYLGQVLSELTIARAQADLEAVRIAEMYANHELLKHFPIPRVRVKEVSLDIPVVILETDDPPDEVSPRGGVTAEELSKRYLEIFRQQASIYKFRTNNNERQTLKKDIDSISKKLAKPTFVQVDTNLTARKFTASVKKMFAKKGETFGQKKFQSFLNSLEQTAKIEFINDRIEEPRILIGATSAEIKEAPNEAVFRISMNITEDGLEWTHIMRNESEDDDFRLVPE